MKIAKILLICMLFFAGNLMAQNQIVVDPNAQIREVKEVFNSIKVSNGIDVMISQSTEQGLAVSANDPKIVDKIITTIENGVLKIYYDKQGGFFNNKKMKVYVSFIELEKIEATGASDITVLGTLKSKNFNLKLSGASDFKGKVEADVLDMNISGSSDVTISGEANVLNLDNSGASDFKGYGLVVNVCNTKSSGASDVRISVNNELNVRATGASDVYYKGSPATKTIHSSGASTVAMRE